LLLHQLNPDIFKTRKSFE